MRQGVGNVEWREIKRAPSLDPLVSWNEGVGHVYQFERKWFYGSLGLKAVHGEVNRTGSIHANRERNRTLALNGNDVSKGVVQPHHERCCGV